jgi:hypothetical protein
VQNHWRARKFFGSAMPADVEEFSPAIQNGRRKSRENSLGRNDVQAANGDPLRATYRFDFYIKLVAGVGFEPTTFRL